jgi:type I restriction enzyme S subunit
MTGPQDSRPKLAENVRGALRPYPEYKASGLPWLGEIPAHWQEKRAKYFFREVDERSTTGDEELLSVSHVTGVTPRSQKNVTMFMAESYVGHKLCRPADLVINTMWAWMSALGVAKQPGIVSPAYAVYRPIAPGAFSPEFLDHLLRTQPYASEYWCRSTGIRASRLRLYPEGFLEIPIACPPQPEQDQIVVYLKAKDQQIRRFIRAKRRLIALLNEERQGIIHRAVTHGLDPSVPLKRSGVKWLGEVPAHWEVKRLKWVVRLQRGYDLPQEQRTPGPFPVVSSGGVIGTHCEARSRGPGVVMGRYGSTDAVYYISDDFWPHNTSLFVTDFQGNLPYWCYYLLRTISKGDHAGKSAVPGVDRKDLFDIYVPAPPPGEQVHVVSELQMAETTVDGAISRAKRQIDLLREYRTRLIADVVTGKLDVRGVELPVLDEVEPVDDASPDDEEAGEADLDAATEDAVGSPEE